MQELTFRKAQPQDLGLVLDFIKALALYEKMPHEVVATRETLNEWLFERKAAEVLFLMEGDKEIGYCLYFTNFSTFQGRAGLYLEDVFVLPEYRGRGYGKATLRELARIAVDRGYGRMEWACLDWNEPSIKFYRSLGAQPMDEWTVYRLSGDTLSLMAQRP